MGGCGGLFSPGERVSASSNDFSFRKVSKAKGQTASGLPVQVEFIFVALFWMLFVLAKETLTLLWCSVNSAAVPCSAPASGREECVLFCAMETPVGFQRLKLCEMRKNPETPKYRH